jgi:Domain of unknown function (DUF6647)
LKQISAKLDRSFKTRAAGLGPLYTIARGSAAQWPGRLTSEQRFREDAMDRPIILGLALLGFMTVESWAAEAVSGANKALPSPIAEAMPQQAARPAGPSPHLLASIVTWLSTDFAVPDAYRHPRIEFASPMKMAAIRYRALGAGLQAQAIGEDLWPANMRDTMALYEDASRTIYLREGWTGATPAEMSVLVHEMVHHLQNLAGQKFACSQAREKPAYAAQQKWVELAGGDFFQEFETDPLTLKLRTTCGF